MDFVHQNFSAPTPPKVSSVPLAPVSGWLKIAYFFGLIVSLVSGVVFLIKEITRSRPVLPPEILFETNYQVYNWEGFGRIFEPLIDIPIYYPQIGYQTETFLLDSGALVSSLPREIAGRMGLSLAMLPRSTFSGYGNTTSFAYRSNLKAILGTEEIQIPVVFTEAAGTKPILGRSGFFEKYNITFNAKEEKIRISK